MILIILIVITIVTILYVLLQRNYTHWARLGIPFEPPHIPFGSLDAVRRKERAFGLVMSDIYRRHVEHKIVGIYLLFRPAILIRDAELARKIMTSDFASFHDRGVYVDEKNDELSANLFNLRGQSWRTLRAKLTPSFSSGKIKGMFGTIDAVASKVVDHLNGALAKQQSGVEQAATVEMKELMTTYAIDIIGSVIFGLEIDSFSQPNNEFRVLSQKILKDSGLIVQILNVCTFICPTIAGFLTKLGFRDPLTLGIRDIMRRTIEFRERNNFKRKDLLQLLIQLRNTGKISEDDDKIWDVETAAESLKSMSIDMIASQGFLFYIAGSETTAATASFTLYELAMYPELLQRAQLEVESVLAKHGLDAHGKYSYEALQDMTFLDLCIMETVRKYPGLPFLNRECTKDYQVPDTTYTITKGTPIIIPLYGIHHDADYFPNPNKYDPDRFSPESGNYVQTAYMPFGEGPRHCIAKRMGQVNAKVAIAKVLANFEISPIPLKELEFQFESAPVFIPKDGLQLRLTKKKNVKEI